MAFDLSRFQVMEHLWDGLEKTPDGEHVRYFRIDLEQLWWMGFVDTAAHGMEEWIAVFEPYHQEDGSYLMGKDAFLALDQYRYQGEIKVPFDPMLINEGRYTDEGFDELIGASIAPSCSMTPDELREFFDQFKKEFRQPDGLLLIRRPAKERIRVLLDDHSSPLRNLEILVDQMFHEKGKELVGQVDEAEAHAAGMQAALAASRFSSTPTSRSEEKARALEGLQKVRRRHEPAEVEGVNKVELKRIRRSRKGMRG